jgi:hypothetical protein
MKSKLQFLRWPMMLMLSASALGAWAQGPFPLTGNESVCLNSTHNYGTVDTPTSSYSWTITPAIGGSISSTGHNTISVLWQTAGVYALEVTETSNSECVAPIASIQVTVDALNTIVLTSAVGTNNQTACINTPLTKITYATTGATGVTFSGLPAGVTGNWSADVVTISGTSSASGTFSYLLTLTGGCGNVTSTGTITVTTSNSIVLTSAVGTDNNSICINTPITNITYATTGATGATFSGLPAGITGNWAANVVTISGTPSASGTFSYTVTLTGGCANVNSTGVITVTTANTITLTSALGTDIQTACINTSITNITYATTGATGATFSGLPAGVTGNWAANVVRISGTPSASGTFNYVVTLTSGCGNVTSTGTITSNPLPATSPIYHN